MRTGGSLFGLSWFGMVDCLLCYGWNGYWCWLPKWTDGREWVVERVDVRVMDRSGSKGRE